jgi:hypothetical protein
LTCSSKVVSPTASRCPATSQAIAAASVARRPASSSGRCRSPSTRWCRAAGGTTGWCRRPLLDVVTIAAREDLPVDPRRVVARHVGPGTRRTRC